jgi:hypothetical protein
MTVPKQRTPQNNELAPNDTVGAEPVAEEANTNSTAQPAGTTESSGQQEVAFATEQPVPSVPEEKLSQYIVTVDNQTGLLAKVEKLAAAGERMELSQEELEQVGLFSAAGGENTSELASSTDDNSLLAAYYQGVADYLNNLT